MIELQRMPMHHKGMHVGVMLFLLLLSVACSSFSVPPIHGRVATGDGQPAQTMAPRQSPTVLPVTSIPPTPTPLSEHSVAYLLQHRPQPRTTMEIDAFFSGASHPHVPTTPPPGHAWCLPPWATTLTDQPFPSLIAVLSGVRNNYLPQSTPYLIAVAPEALKPNVDVLPNVPFHARIRGHLDDPAVADCPLADRIFIAEQVVTVYQQDPPLGVLVPQLPADYAAWQSYHDAAHGYSVLYPPNWQVTTRSDPRFLATIEFHSAQVPSQPLLLRVRAHETPITGYIPADPPPLTQGDGFNTYTQGVLFGAFKQDSQRLGGYAMDREVGATEREVTVLFNAHDQTYELTLRYHTGFELPQATLAIYSTMVESFRLEQP